MSKITSDRNVTSGLMSAAENNLETCSLCGLYPPIENSHVLPAFAFRWLRKRSITSHIRSGSNPNRRSQDGEKANLLCKKCESLFGNFERNFSSHAFYPAVNGTWDGQYRKWLLKFCVSISWRVLLTMKGRNPAAEYTEEQMQLCLKAERAWRDFLLSHSDHPGNFVQHAVPWDLISESNIPGLPENINRFLSDAIEMDVVGTSDFLATYSKLGPFMIFGVIQPGTSIWKGTQVRVNGGNYFETNKTLPSSLIGFLVDRAKNVARIQDQLSPDQKAVIAYEVDRRIGSLHEKAQFSAILADAKLFGLDAILTEPKEK